MSNINSRITNTDIDAEEVLINKTLFDTMYKKKISLKDWLLTKSGLASIAVIFTLWLLDELKMIHLLLWLAFGFTMLRRSTTLAHTKEKNIWGKVILNKIIQSIEAIKPFRERVETDEIIKECTIEPKKKKRIIRKKKKKI